MNEKQAGKGSDRRKGDNQGAFEKGYVGIHWPSRDKKKTHNPTLNATKLEGGL